MTAPVLPGAEPWSHVTDHRVGVLAIHGFTGTPLSMRGIAEAAAAAGYQVELPRLPGHGTTVDDMLPTTWADWAAEADAAYRRLAARTDRVVVVGQSMGGSLALQVALDHPEVAGVVCINPLTVPQPALVMEMLHEMVDEGTEVIPGIGSDIADPDARELSYDGTPIRPLISLMADGIAALTDRFGELTMPLRLFTSHHDHVVEPSNSEHLAATHGGPVDHTWLERSFHVATQDYDRDLIVDETLDFVAMVVAS